MIPIYKPYLTKESLKFAHDAIDSTWISSHGKYLDLAKDQLKQLSGCEYVILTNNGTSATHLTSLALEFKHPNVKNIVVPSNVYVAAWNMFLVNPKYNLIPIDADPDTWNISLENLDYIYNKHSEDTAFLGVHNIGNIIPMHIIKTRYPKWILIEDNCEGFLGKYDNKPSGSISLASSVSFFGNKSITSGEGGMFCTNDKEVFEYINRAKSHFITKDKFVFDELGYNYRMTNVQASILCGQIDVLSEILSNKNEIFGKYKEELKPLVDMGLISFQHQSFDTLHSNWMFGIKINGYNKEKLDKLILHLYRNDIDSRPMFPPINFHKHLSHITEKFKISNQLYEQVIILPSYPDLNNSDVLYICEKIKTYFL